MESPFHSPDQIAAVKEYERSRRKMRDAMGEHGRAWKACRAAGLEHRQDSMGRSRWPEEQGDWRPVAGEPIRV